ncbi:hypothetical protein I5Q34_09430 [Streptomyces sp. AV19]|uniref:hypothetical protein n=1 Tax=Streptomyces sp. AV19 TaxID=2793068 RepID=UPI0018FE6C36|nr:hypothetical protein [Streptomyces sp. AV19]MBH1934505.1 hypothetical protein [Streptomyces sp. AV19]MDG4533299.1 hypothetical protein [Streptomyces sp. AV19]
MRRLLCATATGSALVLGGALGAPAAVADPPPRPDPLVGAATIGISPHETVNGKTVSITGACAPYPGASVRSVSSRAGQVGLTDIRPEHIRGTLLVTAGQGTYPVRLVCSNGSAQTQLRVDASPPGPAPAPQPHPVNPAHHGQNGGRGLAPVHHTTGQTAGTGPRTASGTVPQGAPRTGAAPSNGDAWDADLFLAGVGVAVVAGTIVVTVRRPSGRSRVR